MPTLWSPETRRRTLLWMVGILLTIVLVVVSAYLWGGSPPSKIVFATGQPGGVYDSFGREYQKRLGAQASRSSWSTPRAPSTTSAASSRARWTLPSPNPEPIRW
jgi:hypothetical protein